MAESSRQPDKVDQVVADWNRERPDLDVASMAALSRLTYFAQTMLGTAADQAVTRHGIQKGEFDVLATLRRGGPPYTLTPSLLSAELFMSRAGMTKRLDHLAAAGLVTRDPTPQDRRSLTVTLTAKGMNLVDAAFTDLVAVFHRLTAALSESERDDLDRIMRILIETAERSTVGEDIAE